MTAGKDWQAWHAPYADETSPLSRRLRLVQRHIDSWLDDRQGTTERPANHSAASASVECESDQVAQQDYRASS